MATLFLTYDLDAKTVRGASIGGKFLYGLSSVTLNNGSVSLRHFDGHDMLGEAPGKTDAPPIEDTKLQLEIAKSLGFEEDAA